MFSKTFYTGKTKISLMDENACKILYFVPCSLYYNFIFAPYIIGKCPQHVSPYCTQHRAHSTQHTAHSTLHTAHCTQHTAHSTPHTAHCTQHTVHCTLYTAHSTRLLDSYQPYIRLAVKAQTFIQYCTALYCRYIFTSLHWTLEIYLLHRIVNLWSCKISQTFFFRSA